MGCEAVRPLLHPHLDGELGPDREQEVRQHLATCPCCAREYDDLRALQDSLRATLPRFEPPASLQTRIEASLLLLRPSGPTSPRWHWRRAGTIAIAAVGLAAGSWALAGAWQSWSQESAMARQVVASHQRCGTSGWPDGIESSDPRVVRKWLAGHTCNAPEIPDLSDHGFVLAGGRSDKLANGIAATLVYRRGNHIWNLMSQWSTRTLAGGELRLRQQEGERVAHWSVGGQDFWVGCDGDVSEADLRNFVELFRERTAGQACRGPGAGY